MNVIFGEYGAPTFHPHWLAFWRRFLGIALLVGMGLLGFVVWVPLGFIFWAMAAASGVSIYLEWSWNTCTFTADRRLIRRRGFMGCARDIISLFGTITPYQIPILGQWLDMGSVELRIPGQGQIVYIRHIAHFQEFCRLLMAARQWAGTQVIPAFF